MIDGGPVPLSEIDSLSGYLMAYGSTLAHKAISGLSPLHVPGRDPVPTFSYVPERRKPFEAQADLIAAQVKELDQEGSGFVIGEMGVGKSLCAILSVHEHARRGAYRAIVLCPDHLIRKWKEREIEATLPNAKVITFDKWWEFLELASEGYSDTNPIPGQRSEKPPATCWVSTGEGTAEEVIARPNPTAGLVVQRRKRWKKPDCPTILVCGRDQIKRMPGWSGLGSADKSCFNGPCEGYPSKTLVTGHTDVLNERGQAVRVPTTDKFTVCPRCGAVPTKKGKDTPLGQKELSKSTQHSCHALVMREIGTGEAKANGLDVLYGKDIPHEVRAKPGQVVRHAGKTWKVQECGEPLWQWIRRPNWWAAANIIQRKLRRMFTYLIVDEAHEQKSDTSAQSMAMGKILGVTEHCIGLTGTFIGGYASHLYPLMMRMAAGDMRARGFEWGKDMPFVEKYGVIETTYKSTAPVESTRSAGTRSMRKVRIGSTDVSRKCRPGIMPTLFSEIVMHKTIFLRLAEFVDGLPAFDPQPVPCRLPPDIQAEYDSIRKTLTRANAELLSSGNMKLLGRMLWTLLQYPDHPFGWEPMFHADPEQDLPDTHAVGWWEVPKLYTRGNFVGVATPRNFDLSGIVLPKEEELIRRCRKYKELGDQTWVGCEMTQKMDIMPRLAAMAEAEGLTPGILKSKDAKPRDREEWIERHGRNFDLMLSHPQLVATGLDLFSPHEGGHNFNHISFFQTGYNLFRMIQFSRRAWRISQWKDCTVDYLYYEDTAQAAALALMGRKLQALLHLQEGTIEDDGLAAMGGASNDQMAMVNALGERVDSSEIQRNWTKVKSDAGSRHRSRNGRGARDPEGAPGVRIAPSTGREARYPELQLPGTLYRSTGVPAPGVPSPALDSLPLSLQIAAAVTARSRDEEEIEKIAAQFKDWVGEEAIDEDACESESNEYSMSKEEIESLLGEAAAGSYPSTQWDW